MVIKWMLMAFGLATMLTGTQSLILVKQPSFDLWWLLASIWLIAGAFQVWGPFNSRVSEFGLRLPISSRRLATVNLLATVILSGGMLLMCLLPQTLFIKHVIMPSRNAPESFALFGTLLPKLWTHGVAWWLLLVAVTVSDRPQLATVPRDRRWYLRQSAGFFVGAAGMILLGSRLGHVLAFVVALIAIAWIVWTMRSLPSTLTLAPIDLATPPPRREATGLADDLPPWRRPPLWFVVMRGCSKHGGIWVVSLPFAALFGLWLSNAVPALLPSSELALLFLAITAYMVFTFAATPLLRFSRFAHLPISNDQLLAILLVPQLMLLTAGYVAGELWAAPRGRVAAEPLIFVNDSERYGLRMNGRYFHLAVGRPPDQVAPDGTIISPPDDWRPRLLPGVVLYKPYHTPPGASLDVCAWQLERASEHVFGEVIPAAVFRDRYLTVDEDGVVVTRDEDGFQLMADYPHLRARWLSVLPALQALVAGVLFQISFISYLWFFRPGRSHNQRKYAFGGVLTALMALHLAPFLLDIFAGIDAESMAMAGYAACDLIERTWPGGAWSAWAVVAVVLGAGHLLIRRQFRRAEWPPVREGDTFVDCLG
jgi:hypothetical protein